VAGYQDKMMEIAQGSRDLLAALQRPGVEDKAELLRTLYARARLESPMPQQPQEEQQAPQPPPEMPFSVSGTQSAPQQGEKTDVDRFKEYLIREDWQSGLNFQ